MRHRERPAEVGRRRSGVVGVVAPAGRNPSSSRSHWSTTRSTRAVISASFVGKWYMRPGLVRPAARATESNDRDSPCRRRSTARSSASRRRDGRWAGRGMDQGYRPKGKESLGCRRHPVRSAASRSTPGPATLRSTLGVTGGHDAGALCRRRRRVDGHRARGARPHLRRGRRAEGRRPAEQPRRVRRAGGAQHQGGPRGVRERRPARPGDPRRRRHEHDRHRSRRGPRGPGRQPARPQRGRGGRADDGPPAGRGPADRRLHGRPPVRSLEQEDLRRGAGPVRLHDGHPRARLDRARGGPARQGLRDGRPGAGEARPQRAGPGTRGGAAHRHGRVAV